MDPRHLLELKKREPDYWWHVGKRRMILALAAKHIPLGGRVLDVGGGAGLTSVRLAEKGWRMVMGDISHTACRLARENKHRNCLVFDAEGGLPFGPGVLDGLLFLDVLEHLKNDRLVLAEAGRVLKPGGTCIITVPAYPTLFSAWDEALHHKRRYTKKSLLQVAAAADLEPKLLSYWNMVSVAPAFVSRWLLRGSTPEDNKAEFPDLPRPVNAALRAIVSLEARAAQGPGLPAGLTLVGVFSPRQGG